LGWTVFQKPEKQQPLKELDEFSLPVYKHYGYTVVTDEIFQIIKEKQLEEVYLAGIFTDVCIVKTALDLFDRGIATHIVDTCMGTLHGEHIHEAVMESMKYSIGAHNFESLV
jgi:nicotinamidase-related amidase